MMAIWCRIKQLQLKSLSNQFKRSYCQIYGRCSINQTFLHTKVCVLDKPNCVSHKKQFDFCNNVRFFAAPVQAKPKQEEKDASGPRLNEQINAEYVRLVMDEGHGIVPRREALERARKLKLDLVEVQRNAKPPVCKLMDYHKEKYKQQIKEKDRVKGKSEVTLRKGDCKEVRFAAKIEQKDLQIKADMVKRLMERGYRVKCMAMGSDDQDLGGLLSRLSALIEDVCVVESGPRVEKRQAYVIVRHVKFGPSKKGSVNKASKVVAGTNTQFQKAVVSSSTDNAVQSALQFEVKLNETESCLESEDDSEEATMSPSREMSDEDLEKNQSAWSVFDANENFDEAFDFRDDVSRVAKGPTREQMKTELELSSSLANTFPEFGSSGPILDSRRTQTMSSSLSEAPLGTENRYRREPRERFSPTKSINVKGPGIRDSTRLEPLFPSQGRQAQFNLNAMPPTTETKRVECEGSMFRNLRLPAEDIRKQEPSFPTAPSFTAPSYGVFSAVKANDTPGKDGAPAEVNRYRKVNTFDSTRNSGPVGFSRNQRSPTAHSDGGKGAGVDEGEQGGWGIFSTESSKVNPNRNTESQAKVQRQY